MYKDGMGWDGMDGMGGGRRGKEEGQSLVTVSLSRVTQQPLLQGAKRMSSRNTRLIHSIN